MPDRPPEFWETPYPAGTRVTVHMPADDWHPAGNYEGTIRPRPHSWRHQACVELDDGRLIGTSWERVVSGP